ncbi:Hypothetical predicted protein [Octopus vulgaris]|uniref:Uncharacterized protein n=1 Tax=Octopus vulgaris TaxID=6645 RepID=A0AA36AXP2_OCTVU|nr:Hypothetical predicted protein [Octopus vulgaris]
MTYLLSLYNFIGLNGVFDILSCIQFGFDIFHKSFNKLPEIKLNEENLIFLYEKLDKNNSNNGKSSQDLHDFLLSV